MSVRSRAGVGPGGWEHTVRRWPGKLNTHLTQEIAELTRKIDQATTELRQRLADELPGAS